jgi:CRISPR-associated protein Cas1
MLAVGYGTSKQACGRALAYRCVPLARAGREARQGRIDAAVGEAFENLARDSSVAPSGPEVETPPPAPPVSQPPVAPEPGAGGSTFKLQPASEAPSVPDSQQSTITSQPPAPNSEPLPARMLNEFVYCPRLFYYEFVEGVFVHNADTLRGAAIHTRVDSGSGALPAADAEPSTINFFRDNS